MPRYHSRGLAVVQALPRKINMGVTGATWDSATKSAAVTLSGSDLTATNTGTGIVGVKTAWPKSSGKWYIEYLINVRVDAGANTAGVVGLARYDQAAATVGQYRGIAGVITDNTTGGTSSYCVDGSVVANDVSAGPLAGRVYGIAVDLDAGLFWIRQDAGNWNANASANPATATGGVSLADLAGYPLTPYATFYANTASITLRTLASSHTYGAPSGFTAGWPATSAASLAQTTTTLNSGKKDSTVTLSNGNLTATKNDNGSGDGHARSKDYKSSGKQYVEWTVGSWIGGDDGVGICQYDATATNLGTSGTKGAMVFKSGNIYANNANSGTTLGAVANGNRIDMAVDWGNKRIWFRKNGGNWNANVSADPATNTGGISISSLPHGAPFAVFGGAINAAGANVTLNAGATAFSGSVPSGFESGWDLSDI